MPVEQLEGDGGRSARKHRAILGAAEQVFLRSGYVAASMDEVAALAGVSKQTVYKHFGSKEALFVGLVTAMTTDTGDRVHPEPPGEDVVRGDFVAYLEDYATRQLTTVLTPRVMQLRRLVIGEVGRFPGLAAALEEFGPRRAIAALQVVVERLAAGGRLRVSDARLAAEQLNWLVMAAPLNAAMLGGDGAIPSPEELRAHAVAGVRTFLAAYGAEEDGAGGTSRSARP